MAPTGKKLLTRESKTCIFLPLPYLDFSLKSQGNDCSTYRCSYNNCTTGGSVGSYSYLMCFFCKCLQVYVLSVSMAVLPSGRGLLNQNFMLFLFVSLLVLIYHNIFVQNVFPFYSFLWNIRPMIFFLERRGKETLISQQKKLMERDECQGRD